jgi:hypothetical protein
MPARLLRGKAIAKIKSSSSQGRPGAFQKLAYVALLASACGWYFRISQPRQDLSSPYLVSFWQSTTKYRISLSLAVNFFTFGFFDNRYGL